LETKHKNVVKVITTIWQREAVRTNRARICRPLAGVAGNTKHQFLQKREFDERQVGLTDDEVGKHVADSQIVPHQQHAAVLLDKRLHGHVHLLKTLHQTLH